MKKLFFTMVAFVVMATSAFAQIEQGKIYIGGASQLGFSNEKIKDADNGTNYFNLDVNGGYFIIENLSVNANLAEVIRISRSFSPSIKKPPFGGMFSFTCYATVFFAFKYL